MKSLAVLCGLFVLLASCSLDTSSSQGVLRFAVADRSSLTRPDRDYEEVSKAEFNHAKSYPYLCLFVTIDGKLRKISGPVKTDSTSATLEARLPVPKLSVGRQYELTLYGYRADPGDQCADNPSLGIIKEQLGKIDNFDVPQKPQLLMMPFRLNGWIWDSYLKPQSGDCTNTAILFGTSLAYSYANDLLVVGAPGCSVVDSGVIKAKRGIAYVFKYVNSHWIQIATLTPPTNDSYQNFGAAVAISDNYIVVGGKGDPQIPQPQMGKIHVFAVVDVTSNTQPTPVYTQTGDGNPDLFGFSVSISSDDKIIVGAVYKDDGSAPNTGAIYEIKKDPLGWVKQIITKPSNLLRNSQFGYAVSIAGDALVGGATAQDDSSGQVVNSPPFASYNSITFTENYGAAYIYGFSSGVWTEKAYLKVPIGELDNRNLGCSVAIDPTPEQVVVIGENFGGRNDQPGFAYVFDYKEDDTGVDSWQLSKTLSAPNARPADRFGQSVSVFEGTVVVGAMQEKSSSPVISNGGIPTLLIQDYGTQARGAVYVFERDTAGRWQNQAYLKAPNADKLESHESQFGQVVVIDHDFIFVGANQEDGGGTAVIEGDTSLIPYYPGTPKADNAGAVYVFRGMK